MLINSFLHLRRYILLVNFDLTLWCCTKYCMLIQNINVFEIQLSEIALYKAVVNWTKHNREERQDYFLSLFQVVDLTMISSNFVEETVSCEVRLRNVFALKVSWILYTKSISMQILFSIRLYFLLDGLIWEWVWKNICFCLPPGFGSRKFQMS